MEPSHEQISRDWDDPIEGNHRARQLDRQRLVVDPDSDEEGFDW